MDTDWRTSYHRAVREVNPASRIIRLRSAINACLLRLYEMETTLAAQSERNNIYLALRDLMLLTRLDYQYRRSKTVVPF